MTTTPIRPEPSLRRHRFRITTPDDPHRGEYGTDLGKIGTDHVALGVGPASLLLVYPIADLARGCGCPFAKHDDDCVRPVWACPLCDRSDEITVTVTRVFTAVPQSRWQQHLVVYHITVDKRQDQARQLHCDNCDHTYDVPEGLELSGM
jgi:hypothetical protein